MFYQSTLRHTGGLSTGEVWDSITILDAIWVNHENGTTIVLISRPQCLVNGLRGECLMIVCDKSDMSWHIIKLKVQYAQ